MTFKPRFTGSHRITADLARTKRAHGFLEAAPLSKDWIHRTSAAASTLNATWPRARAT